MSQQTFSFGGRHEKTCPRTLAISEFNTVFSRMFAGDGTTPFKAKLDDINLNCDDNGVLNVYTSKPADSSDFSNSNSDYYYKDPCKSS
ncbi:hypothetical protein C2G38_2197575 [Gigaspora rosea]|uniref:Uncharacterized protein n=1 Tax=Gigaspora rosea TaxID=44941 RepID=A0A397UV92_9GLOM|nr:hypothetical protein C2G38_2197575 [Gigaspora rosea]